MVDISAQIYWPVTSMAAGHAHANISHGADWLVMIQSRSETTKPLIKTHSAAIKVALVIIGHLLNVPV
ncbi:MULTISPECIES: hypothetical protein [Pseudomonas syringae group]|uniref:hypothetical protein n=1 Tax=Pseudomonas syringae group TaxID=136849 RepID=UPI0007609F6C|nr:MULTISPECIES: hypothetical protein [Pseudomonas syringae group]KWT06844.1 hypothetical protein AL046_22975 [Pseudomonas syringae pv. avii]PHN72884.1 hypothetical protein AO286_04895 [Pseudomonas syringae]POQ09505.1 hypothetical protein CXB40_03935 [Pseudomonas syringae pv. avii]